MCRRKGGRDPCRRPRAPEQAKCSAVSPCSLTAATSAPPSSSASRMLVAPGLLPWANSKLSCSALCPSRPAKRAAGLHGVSTISKSAPCSSSSRTTPGWPARMACRSMARQFSSQTNGCKLRSVAHCTFVHRTPCRLVTIRQPPNSGHSISTRESTSFTSRSASIALFSDSRLSEFLVQTERGEAR